LCGIKTPDKIVSYSILREVGEGALALTRRAKMLTEKQEAAVLGLLDQHGRYRERNAAMFTLSVKGGLRAKEISMLTWSMITDAEGRIADAISLENKASKGKRGGRRVPLNRHLRLALERLQDHYGGHPRPESPVIRSERGRNTETGGRMSAGSIADWFGDLYNSIGLEGCSSHSGRRTFITRTARKIGQVGGSLRDVQYLAGHASLSTTQIYIDGDSEAQRKVVELI
jgi:integrase/recombinase XerD